MLWHISKNKSYQVYCIYFFGRHILLVNEKVARFHVDERTTNISVPFKVKNIFIFIYDTFDRLWNKKPGNVFN